MRRSVRLVLLVATVGAFGTGCEDPIPPITVTVPDPVTIEFIDSININGAKTLPFAVNSAGGLTATIRSLMPEDAVIGLALGTFNGSACQVIIANDFAPQGSIVVGSAGAAGVLCVRVYDVGQLTETAAFEIEIIHP